MYKVSTDCASKDSESLSLLYHPPLSPPSITPLSLFLSLSLSLSLSLCDFLIDIDPTRPFQLIESIQFLDGPPSLANILWIVRISMSRLILHESYFDSRIDLNHSQGVLDRFPKYSFLILRNWFCLHSASIDLVDAVLTRFSQVSSSITNFFAFKVTNWKLLRFLRKLQKNLKIPWNGQWFPWDCFMVIFLRKRFFRDSQGFP